MPACGSRSTLGSAQCPLAHVYILKGGVAAAGRDADCDRLPGLRHRALQLLSSMNATNDENASFVHDFRFDDELSGGSRAEFALPRRDIVIELRTQSYISDGCSLRDRLWLLKQAEQACIYH